MTIPRKKALEQLGFEWYRFGGRGISSQNIITKKFSSKKIDNNNVYGRKEEEANSTRMIDTTKVPCLAWDEQYKKLFDYFKKHGHSNFPQNFKENSSLLTWVKNQRIVYNDFMKEKKRVLDNNRNLSKERVSKLSAISFDFKLIQSHGDEEKVNDLHSEDNFDSLMSYMSFHCNEETRYMYDVKVNHIGFEGIDHSFDHTDNVSEQNYPKLSNITPLFVSKSNYSSCFIDRNIFFQTNINKQYEVNVRNLNENKRKKNHIDWEERILELQQYKIRKGDCNVPDKWRVNPSLSEWVNRQRLQYRLLKEGKISNLNEGRMRQLEDIGFQFEELRTQSNNMEKYTGNDYVNISTPLKSVRQIFVHKNKNHMSSLAYGMTHLKEDKWTDNFGKLQLYRDQKGHCNVPRKWKEDPVLGEWVHFQRRQYRLKRLNRRNHMSDEKFYKLDNNGFEWSRITFSHGSQSIISDQHESNPRKRKEIIDIRKHDKSFYIQGAHAREMLKSNSTHSCKSNDSKIHDNILRRRKVDSYEIICLSSDEKQNIIEQVEV